MGICRAGFLLWSVAPILVVARVRWEHSLSGFQVLRFLVNPTIGGLLVGVGTRGRDVLVVAAALALTVLGVVTIALIEPGAERARWPSSS